MRRRTLSQVAFYEAVLPHLNMVERQDYDGKEGPPGHPDLKELDALTKEFIDKLLVQAATDSKFVRSCYDLIFVARALERIADHATNIAEDSFWRDQAMIFVIPILQKKRNPIRALHWLRLYPVVNENVLCAANLCPRSVNRLERKRPKWFLVNLFRNTLGSHTNADRMILYHSGAMQARVTKEEVRHG